MSAPQPLRLVESNVAPTTENCRYCWMCRHVCPVGRVTARETLTPHAWALVIESVKRGQLAWDRDTADVVYACADCGLCRTHCVTDQPLPDAIAEARAAIVEAGVAPPSVYTFQQQASRAPVLSRAVAPAASRVGLFIGDTHDFNGSAGLNAMLALLKSAGVEPVAVCSNRSNGLLASSLGLRTMATDAARSVLAELAEANIDELLVRSAADRWTFEYVYPNRLEVPWPASIKITEVLDVIFNAWRRGVLSLVPRSETPPYAYHDPCYGARVGRTGATARTLLSAALGVEPSRELFWRDQRAHPCGAIGGLTLTRPEIAAALAQSRLNDAVSAGARWVITDDETCAAHLAAHATGEIEIRGLYELLAAQHSGAQA